MKKKNKVVINVDCLSLLDKAINLNISYDDEEDQIYMTPLFKADKDLNMDLKKFELFLNSYANPENLTYLGIKRFLKNERIEYVEMSKTENFKDMMQIVGHGEKYLNILDIDAIRYNDVLVNHLWKKMGKDFTEEYTTNKDKIDNICIYDSNQTTQFKYIDKDKTLYVTNSYGNAFSDTNELISKIITDFNSDKTPKNYLENEDRIKLEYEDNKSITIHNKKYLDKYKNTIEKFQNDLIEVKRKTFIKKRDDKHGYGKNG